MKFCKFHGFGNDYLVLERDELPDDVDLTQLAGRICERHTGVGADGIAIIKPLDSKYADFYCDIVNPDGSLAGFSGNGTRCAAAYLFHKRIWRSETLRLETLSGVKTYRLLDPGGSGE
jgi:diaminopimelate epimerase